jgi:hypothetical protein
VPFSIQRMKTESKCNLDEGLVGKPLLRSIFRKKIKIMLN